MDLAALTDEELAEMEGRAEAATAGPWQVDMESDGDGEPMGEWWTYPVGVDSAKGPTVFRFDDDYGTDQMADATFIAHARTDVPRLIAALRASRAEVERLSQTLALYAGSDDPLRGP